jgi:DnaJ domain
MGMMTYYYDLGDLLTATTTSTTTTITTTIPSMTTTTPPPPTPAKPSLPQPTNNKPWTIATFLIDQFDAEYNDERYATTHLDPCNVTKYDLGLPFGFFADRFLQSSHAPLCHQPCQPCQPCQPPQKQNLWWRSLQFVMHRVVFWSSTNDTDDVGATNRMIPRQDLHGAVKNWRSDEVAAMKMWVYERATLQHYWAASSTASSSANNNKEQPDTKTFTAQVKDATDQKAIQHWIIVLLKRFTTIPSFVWYVISFTELMWSWRYLLTQVLPLVCQIFTASSTSVGPPLLLIWKASRGFKLHHMLFQMAFPQMYMAYRLAKLGWNALRVYWFVKECRGAVRQIRAVRSTTDFVRVMSSLVMKKIVRTLGSSLRVVLFQVVAIMFAQYFWFGGGLGGGGGSHSQSYESYQPQGPNSMSGTTRPAATSHGNWLVDLLKGLVTALSSTTFAVVVMLLLAAAVARTWILRHIYKEKLLMGEYGRRYSCEERDIAERVLQAASGGGPGVHYRVLAVDPSARRDQIYAAYRQLSHQLHHERNAAPGAAAAFGVVHVAMATLLDEARRTAYDRREHRIVYQHDHHHRATAVAPTSLNGIFMPSPIVMVVNAMAFVVMILWFWVLASSRRY